MKQIKCTREEISALIWKYVMGGEINIVGHPVRYGMCLTWNPLDPNGDMLEMLEHFERYTVEKDSGCHYVHVWKPGYGHGGDKDLGIAACKAALMAVGMEVVDDV